MSLIFTIYSPAGELSTFSLYTDNFGLQLDIVSHFVRSGAKLISVHLIDEKLQKLPLPIAAFDGEPMGDQISELQEEYQKLFLA